MKKIILSACFALLLTSCSRVETPKIPDEADKPSDGIEITQKDDVSGDFDAGDHTDSKAKEDDLIVDSPIVPDEPVPNPIPAEDSSFDETVILSGAALESVEQNVSTEFWFMPSDEAQKLTNGSLMPCPEKNKDGRNAYLTPSGKLVYIDDWTFSKLPEGTVDFKVDWASPDSSVAPANLDCKDYRYPKGLISLGLRNVEISDVKYEFYVDYLYDMGGFSSEASFGCYGVAVAGNVSYTYGFKVNSDEYKGKTLKVTVSDINGNSVVYSGSTDELVVAESRVRTMDSSEWLTWNAVAEILDSNGNIIYSEDFMIKEYEDFANLIELAIQ